MVRATWIVLSTVILAGLTGTSAFRVAINEIKAALNEANGAHENQEQTTTILNAPQLCDTAIVEEVCLDLSDNGYFIKAEFQDRISASDDSVDRFWNELNLADQPTCMDACKAIVENVKKVGVLPPASDVACYTVGGVVHCDRYVGPDVLPTLGPKGDLPATLLQERESSVQQPDEDTIDEDEDDDSEPVLEDTNVDPELSPDLSLSADSSDGLIDYNTWDLVRRAAMLFRIFPESKPDKESSLAEVAMANLTRAVWPPGGEAATMLAQADAKAYVMHTIAAFQDKRTKAQISRWFGSSAFTSTSSRDKIKKTLNSVLNMIDKVLFVPRGRECGSTTYAYVYPKAMKCRASDVGIYPCTRAEINWQSYFVFYLCPYYYSKPEEMVETLVHEGSHHASAYLDDVKYQGATAYGRGRCQSLARGRPAGAIKNADNFCYYVQDVATQVVATPGADDPTPVEVAPPIVKPIIDTTPVTGGDEPGNMQHTCMRSGPTGMHVKKVKPDKLGNCQCKFGSLSCYEGDTKKCPAWVKHGGKKIEMLKPDRYRADCYTCGCKYA